MTTPWTISAAAERVQLDAMQQGETTFTVTNSGPVDARAVLDVVPGENANRAWFTVADPQRLVPYGGSVTFLAKIAVPPGTPAGAYWFAGRTYSADAAPEESSVLSNRVTFEVKPSAAPVPWWKKWWWLIAVAALVVVVLVVVLFVVLSDDDPANPGGQPPQAPPVTVHKSGELVINQTFTADLDELIVGANAAGPDNIDVFFQAQTETVRFVTPENGTQLAEIGPVDDPVAACATASLSDQQIPIGGLATGDVICVRTTENRLSAATVEEPVGPSPGRLRLSVTTFEP
jgi:hypothetical protein